MTLGRRPQINYQPPPPPPPPPPPEDPEPPEPELDGIAEAKEEPMLEAKLAVDFEMSRVLKSVPL